MAKKSGGKRRPVSKSRPASGSQLQRQLQRTDKELLKLLNQRAQLAVQIAGDAEGRPDAGKRAWDPRSEEESVENVLQSNRGPLTPAAVQAIFREIISGSRALVRQLRVAYLGPKYSYSYLATIERFGESADLSPVATIATVFEELDRGHSDYGVVPLENSTDGRVADTLNMFARLPVKICGEVQLRIHHNLLALCPREEIQEIYSKPQALSQCRDWLSRHVPWARTVEMTSTAAAAQLAAGKAGAAAVASRLAASNYSLNIVASNIEDNPDNVTRFAVIGGHSGERTGQDKTALMFEIPHRAGALADIMAVFKRGQLNLTWIESFPMAGSDKEYLFFVEADGHAGDAKLRKALAALQRKTQRLEVLGSYAKSNVVG